MPAALLISILVTTVVAIAVGVQKLPATFTATPDFGTIGQFDLTNVFTVLGVLAAVLTIFSFMLTDFFDTMGTATAISEQAGLVDEEGQPENVGRILLVDSVAAAVGGAAGISSNTSYIESAAGVAEGGRTGFTSVVTGLLFLVAILLSPLALLVPYVATVAGADLRRLPDGQPGQGHRLQRHRGGPAGPARDDPHAADVQHHRRDRGGVRDPRRRQGRPRQDHAKSIRSCGPWRSPS